MTLEDVKRIIEYKKTRLEHLAIPKIWDMYTKNMESGELKEFKQSCIDDEIIIEALEKQIPKEPFYVSDGYFDGKPIFEYAECPNCGNDDFEYGTNNWGCNFCPDCGRALDWSDTE